MAGPHCQINLEISTQNCGLEQLIRMLRRLPPRTTQCGGVRSVRNRTRTCSHTKEKLNSPVSALGGSRRAAHILSGMQVACESKINCECSDWCRRPRKSSSRSLKGCKAFGSTVHLHSPTSPFNPLLELALRWCCFSVYQEK